MEDATQPQLSLDEFVGAEALASFESIRDDSGRLPPPWQVFPEYRPTSMGWRMGTGECYLLYWQREFDGLDQGAQKAYRRSFRAPLYWFWFYLNLEPIPIAILVAITGLITWPLRFVLHLIYRIFKAPDFRLP